MTTMETFSNLIDLDSYSPDEWNMIVELAQQIQKNPALYRSRCSGKIMGTLFYEPSTRTQTVSYTHLTLPTNSLV